MKKDFYYILNPKEEYLIKFQYFYKKLSGSEISLDYLKRAKVYCFFCGPEMIGGFVLANGVNGNCLRYFSIFEDNSSKMTLESLKKLFCVDESKAIEISCVWMKKQVLLNRTHFYRILAFETLKEVNNQKYEFVFGGAIEPHAQRFQAMFLNRIFYQGVKPVREEGVLKNHEGRLVMIYFIRTSELKLKVGQMLFHLYWNKLTNSFSKFQNHYFTIEFLRKRALKVASLL